jgi:hypothetical protein
MLWMRRRWRIGWPEVGVMVQATSPEASGFGRPWFALTVAFALHVLDEASTDSSRLTTPL